DDRRRAPHQPEDGQEPHLEHPDEAPDRQPDPGRGLRGPERSRLAAERPYGRAVAAAEPAQGGPERAQVAFLALDLAYERRQPATGGGVALTDRDGQRADLLLEAATLGLERERARVPVRQRPLEPCGIVALLGLGQQGGNFLQ